MNKVSYIPEREILPPQDGRAWKHHGKYTTIQTQEGYTKRIEPWVTGDVGREVADAGLIAECVELWQSYGWGGNPSSPGKFFHALGGYAAPKWARGWQSHIRGGLPQAFERGHIDGPLYEYDLKSAYLWAGLSLRFPVKVSYARGNESKWIGLFETDKEHPDAPAFYRRRGTHLLERLDVEMYGLTGRFIGGLTWKEKDTLTFEPVLGELSRRMPGAAWDMVRKRYWGAFISAAPVECEIWKNGQCSKSWTVPNPAYNSVWAMMITHAILRRVWSEVDAKTVLIYVDSILTRRKLHAPGQTPGQWRAEAEYDSRGVFVRSAGVWTPEPAPPEISKWLKSAGTPKGVDV